MVYYVIDLSLQWVTSSLEERMVCDSPLPSIPVLSSMPCAQELTRIELGQGEGGGRGRVFQKRKPEHRIFESDHWT